MRPPPLCPPPAALSRSIWVEASGMHAITRAHAGMIQRLTIMASPSWAKIRLGVMRTFCDAPERIEMVKKRGQHITVVVATSDGQIRSGVAGISIDVTPSGASASSTALTSAAGPAIAPASPQPLTPNGL